MFLGKDSTHSSVCRAVCGRREQAAPLGAPEGFLPVRPCACYRQDAAPKKRHVAPGPRPCPESRVDEAVGKGVGEDGDRRRDLGSPVPDELRTVSGL